MASASSSSSGVVPAAIGSASGEDVVSRDRIFGYLPTSTDAAALAGTRLLRLRVIAGHNLAKKDIFGASDPYLRIDLIDSREEVEDTVITRTKKRTLNPKWNEEFVFRVKPLEHKLVLEVFDENRLTRDDFLGMVELPLMNMPRESPDRDRVIPHKHYLLRPRSSRSKVRGHLQLYHAFTTDATGSDESNGEQTSEQSAAGAGQGGGQGGPAGNGWEVVATNSPAAASIDGDPNSGEAFVVDEPQQVAASANNERGSGRSSLGRGLSGGGSSHAAAAASALPPGWEERQDNNGRTYYVNHVSRSTQWQHPGPGPAAAAATSGGGGSDTSRTDSSTRDRHRRSDGQAGANATTTEGGSGSGRTGQPQHQRGGPGGSEAATSAGGGRRVHISMEDSTMEAPPPSRSGSEPVVPPGSSGGSSALPDGLSNLSLGEDEGDSGNGNGAPAGSDPENSSSSTSRTSGGGGGSRQNSRSTAEMANQAGVSSEGLPSGWSLQVAPNGRVFFINHGDKRTTWVDPRTGRPSPLPSVNNVPNRQRHEDDLGPLPEGWEERVHTDGRIFFIDHNTRQTQWEDPRISNPTVAGPAIPYNRDYKRKYEFLKSQLKKPTNVPNKHDIKVRRAHILEDSFRSIMANVRNVDVLKSKLWIEFDGEMGLDYGGVAREWFYLLSKDMFNPYYGLFEYSATDNYTLQINPYSGVCNEDHLSYFKFIGRVAGMAVYHGKLLDGFFIRPFYKMMLGKPIELKDMESVDTEYHNSLLWIKDNDPAEMDLTFQVDEENFGQIISRELKPGGAKESVTNANKEEYIQLVINWRFVSRVEKQMKSFLEGFNELVQLNLLKIFDEGELELLMCGIGAIDVKDWKQHTVYKGDYHANHIVIQWFWRVVLSFNNEMRSRLLQFVTGTSRVPMNGFKELYGSNGPQPFTIEKIGNPNSFPRAHTCFNRLDLPPYESYQQLKEKVVRAIEGSEGFAGVD